MGSDQRRGVGGQWWVPGDRHSDLISVKSEHKLLGAFRNIIQILNTVLEVLFTILRLIITQ